jgi:hypothetical protein
MRRRQDNRRSNERPAASRPDIRLDLGNGIPWRRRGVDDDAAIGLADPERQRQLGGTGDPRPANP